VTDVTSFIAPRLRGDRDLSRPELVELATAIGQTPELPMSSLAELDRSNVVDVDLGNDNTWLINKATGIVFDALGVCGIAPCPGHNAGHFAFGHTASVYSQGTIYIAETVTGRRIQKFVQVQHRRRSTVIQP